MLYQSKTRTAKEGVSRDMWNPTVLLIERSKSEAGRRSTREVEGCVLSSSSRIQTEDEKQVVLDFDKIWQSPRLTDSGRRYNERISEWLAYPDFFLAHRATRAGWMRHFNVSRYLASHTPAAGKRSWKKNMCLLQTTLSEFWLHATFWCLKVYILPHTCSHRIFRRSTCMIVWQTVVMICIGVVSKHQHCLWVSVPSVSMCIVYEYQSRPSVCATCWWAIYVYRHHLSLTVLPAGTSIMHLYRHLLSTYRFTFDVYISLLVLASRICLISISECRCNVLMCVLYSSTESVYQYCGAGPWYRFCLEKIYENELLLSDDCSSFFYWFRLEKWFTKTTFYFVTSVQVPAIDFSLKIIDSDHLKENHL